MAEAAHSSPDAGERRSVHDALMLMQQAVRKGELQQVRGRFPAYSLAEF